MSSRDKTLQLRSRSSEISSRLFSLDDNESFISSLAVNVLNSSGF